MRTTRVPGLLALVLLLAACGAVPSPSRPACPTAAPSISDAESILADAGVATVRTNKGEFAITLDPSSAPIATASFVALARCGFYDQVSFHRVLTGFVIQAGDPQTRTDRGDFADLGSGGPGYRYTVEFPSEDQPYAPYTVAMANAIQYDAAGQVTGGQDTNGSQFFVALDNLPLPAYYSVFGTVTAGTDVVDAIAALPVNDPQVGVPLDPAIIEGISIGPATGESGASPGS
jgi:cyclophilin family peptidyl-prolyl cis-trans isomerase